MTSNDKKLKSIVVLTPYKGQVETLKAKLEYNLDVFTADSFQGKESDVVILSFVRDGGMFSIQTFTS